MTRLRSGFRQARSQRRKTTWTLGPGGDDIATLDVVAVSSSTQFVMGSGIIPTIPELTLVRTRGMLELVLTAATAAGDGFNWACGLCVVSDDAFTVAGINAIPKPFDDADWGGWLWHRFGMLHSPEAFGGTETASANQLIEIDSKAMRKIGANEVMAAIFQSGEEGTAVMDVRIVTRALFKLP